MIAATRFGKPLPAGGTIGVAAAASPYDAVPTCCVVSSGGRRSGYRVKLAEGIYGIATTTWPGMRGPARGGSERALR